MTERSEVVRDPAIMSGDPTVRGTRILAETILVYLRSNAPDEEIRKDYPSLPADGIEAVACWAEVTCGEDWKLAPALRFCFGGPALLSPPAIPTCRVRA